MTPHSPLAQRIGQKIAADIEAEFAREPSTRPHDEHLRTELTDIALALDSLASELSDANSPLTDRVDKIAGQLRALLAHVKGERSNG